MLWLDVQHPEVMVGTSRQNLGEAAVIIAWLREQAPVAKERGETLKCITFYRLQRDLIRAGLDGDNERELRECVVSVDAAQGSEADHVILSMVRSNETGDLGFCVDPRRMCVALSRSRLTLTVVGDPRCMRSGAWRTVLGAMSSWPAKPDDAAVASVQRCYAEGRYASTAPCKFFQEGRCSRAECPFAHVAAGAAQTEAPRRSLETPRLPQKPRDPCHFHAIGRCTKGKSCPFSHDSKPGNVQVAQQLRKAAEPCHFFANGTCRKGSSCTFSHDFQPGDRRVAAAIRTTAEQCRFYARGRCTNGSACTYAH